MKKLSGAGVNGLTPDDLKASPINERISTALISVLNKATEVLEGKALVTPTGAPMVAAEEINKLLAEYTLTTATHWTQGGEEFLLLRLSRP